MNVCDFNKIVAKQWKFIAILYVISIEYLIYALYISISRLEV